MSGTTQSGRPLAITTPLGEDVLLLTGLEGYEAVSGLFRFQLDLLADRDTPVAFDQVLGQSVTVELEVPPDGRRTINGIVSRLSQGRRDEHFTHFRAELVPRLWLLTRKVGSRIFQRMTVPEILDTVLAGVPHRMEIGGVYEPRDFCTQYRESDFAFVSRLMEEEGIRYYFTHSDGAHEMVVSDEPQQHPELPAPEDLAYDELAGGGRDDEMRVTGWEKAQEVRSDLTTLWDHCFELPGKSLESQQPTMDSVAVGEVEHKLKLAMGEPLEVYDYPGRYAQRFDGVASGGAPRPEELKKIFADGLRTVRIRMEEEEMAGLEVRGASTCRHFTAGHRFTLSRHYDANGLYLLTRVEHRASLEGDYRSGGSTAFTYENRFAAIPAALSFRPPRVTPRPTIAGTQTATVVGPAGEELFCDPYGRVKVQFHWDRQGRRDLDSSCWVRVAQTWAGRGWGAFFWPRAGNEVVVAFEEGDPDQPIIVGSVYNAENMPPFPLPLRKELAGIKSASVRGFANQHFNGLVFIDTKGGEHLAIHSQRTMTFNSELDKSFHSGRNKHEAVSNFCSGTVGTLPGGGGSGGGPDENADTESRIKALEDNASYHPWGTVRPMGVPGFNSMMVYGENLAATLGLNHSYVIGSNLAMTANPAFIGELLGISPPPGYRAICGSGIGGNLSMTLGSNTTITLGRTLNLLSGGTDEWDISKSWAIRIVGAILASVTITWTIVYALEQGDVARIWTNVGFEAVIGLLLLTLMLIAARNKVEDVNWWQQWAVVTLGSLILSFYTGEGEDYKVGDLTWKSALTGVATNLGTVVLALLPLITQIAAGATTTAGSQS